MPCVLVLVVHGIASTALASTRVTAGVLSSERTISVPATSVLPALAVMAFIPVVGEPVLAEPTAARRVEAYRWAHLGGLFAFALASLPALHLVAGTPGEPLTVVRNVTGLLGVGLIGRQLLGEAGWLAPVRFAVTELVFGATADATPAAWAWTMHPPGSRPAMETAVALWCGGLVVLAWRWRSPTQST